MEINNTEGLSVSQIRALVNQGGKFVYFPYAISIVVMTFQRKSDIYFIQPGENSFKYSVGYFFINLIAGWWGIPWGPIYTLGALFSHIGGGKNVTEEIVSHLIQNDPEAATNTYNIPNSGSNNAPVPTYNIPNSNPGSSSNSPYNIQ